MKKNAARFGGKVKSESLAVKRFIFMAGLDRKIRTKYMTGNGYNSKSFQSRKDSALIEQGNYCVMTERGEVKVASVRCRPRRARRHRTTLIRETKSLLHTRYGVIVEKVHVFLEMHKISTIVQML